MSLIPLPSQTLNPIHIILILLLHTAAHQRLIIVKNIHQILPKSLLSPGHFIRFSPVSHSQRHWRRIYISRCPITQDLDAVPFQLLPQILQSFKIRYPAKSPALVQPYHRIFLISFSYSCSLSVMLPCILPISITASPAPAHAFHESTLYIPAPYLSQSPANAPGLYALYMSAFPLQAPISSSL